MLDLSFFGGAGEVTGSRALVRWDQGAVLFDCGLFQGHRRDALERNRKIASFREPFDAVLLSHAHIDHSGGLPLLAKGGWRGPIYCTAPTAEICRSMLLDSAHLQKEDAAFFNKIHQRDRLRIEPLYDDRDAGSALALFVPKEYDEIFTPAQGSNARFHNAGHVLGSAMIELGVTTGSGLRRILFTGDLGRRESLLLEPPQPPANIDYLVIESTYGDHAHPSLNEGVSRLRDIILEAVQEKGKILIPSFALERTQELVHVLSLLRRDGQIPAIPLYVDSPLASQVSRVFARHADEFCRQAAYHGRICDGDDPLGLETAHYVGDAEESKRLNDVPGPIIIIAGSGMCEGGRILHHLRNNIGLDSTTVVIVGYQAEGTLGGRLVDGARKVKIFGLEHEVAARVQTLSSFSAHADQEDLLAFVKALPTRPRKVFLVHGDPLKRDALFERLRQEGITRVERPGPGDRFTLD